ESAVVAGHYAAAIGGKEHPLRIARIDHHVIDDQIRGRDAAPSQSAVHALPQASRAARVDHAAVAGIFLDHAHATRAHRNCLDFAEELSTVHALVNAGAGAGVNRGRSLRIDCDREDVGIFIHALGELGPALAAVAGLEGQAPGSGINDVGIFRINSERLNVVNLLGRDASPVASAVV